MFTLSLSTCKMSVSISRVATWWSVILWTVSGGEYFSWFDNGKLFNEVLKCKCRSRKRELKRANKNTVLGIKQDQDRGCFKVIFSSDWVGSLNSFFFLRGGGIPCTTTKEQQQLKFLLLIQNKLTRCDLPPWIHKAIICVSHPCFGKTMCCIANKATQGLLILAGLWHVPRVSCWWGMDCCVFYSFSLMAEICAVSLLAASCMFLLNILMVSYLGPLKCILHYCPSRKQKTPVLSDRHINTPWDRKCCALGEPR